MLVEGQSVKVFFAKIRQSAMVAKCGFSFVVSCDKQSFLYWSEVNVNKENIGKTKHVLLLYNNGPQALVKDFQILFTLNSNCLSISPFIKIKQRQQSHERRQLFRHSLQKKICCLLAIIDSLFHQRNEAFRINQDLSYIV